MGFGEAITTGFQKYVTFTGRARRSEFWFWTLFVFIIGIVFGIIDAVIGNMILGLIVDLVLVLPGIAVSIRRLHDIDKTGWWLLIGLIPIVGAIILIVWDCKDSAPGDNQYGPNPKGIAGQGYQGYGAPGGYPPPVGS